MKIIIVSMIVYFSIASNIFAFKYPNAVSIETLMENKETYDNKKISIEFIFSDISEFNGRFNSLNFKGEIKTKENDVILLLITLPLEDNFFPFDVIHEEEHFIAYGKFQKHGMFAGIMHENFIVPDYMESLDYPNIEFKKKRAFHDLER